MEADPLWLLLMKGHPGVGKSTLARALGRHLRWVVVDRDHTRDSEQRLGLIRAGPYNPADQTGALLYDLTYEVSWTVAEEQLGLGLNVIVDSPLAHERLYLRARALAERKRAILGVVELQLEEEEHKQRVAQRGASAGPGEAPVRFGRWSEVETQLARYNKSWAYGIKNPAVSRLLVDGSLETSEQVDVVLEWIKRRSMPVGSPVGLRALASLECKPFESPAGKPCKSTGGVLALQPRDLFSRVATPARCRSAQASDASRAVEAKREDGETALVAPDGGATPPKQPLHSVAFKEALHRKLGDTPLALPQASRGRPDDESSGVASTAATSRATSPHDDAQGVEDHSRVVCLHAGPPHPQQAELAYCQTRPPQSVRQRMIEKLGARGARISRPASMLEPVGEATPGASGSRNARPLRSSSPPQPQMPQLSGGPRPPSPGSVDDEEMSAFMSLLPATGCCRGTPGPMPLGYNPSEERVQQAALPAQAAPPPHSAPSLHTAPPLQAAPLPQAAPPLQAAPTLQAARIRATGCRRMPAEPDVAEEEEELPPLEPADEETLNPSVDADQPSRARKSGRLFPKAATARGRLTEASRLVRAVSWAPEMSEAMAGGEAASSSAREAARPCQRPRSLKPPPEAGSPVRGRSLPCGPPSPTSGPEAAEERRLRVSSAARSSTALRTSAPRSLSHDPGQAEVLLVRSHLASAAQAEVDHVQAVEAAVQQPVASVRRSSLRGTTTAPPQREQLSADDPSAQTPAAQRRSSRGSASAHALLETASAEDPGLRQSPRLRRTSRSSKPATSQADHGPADAVGSRASVTARRVVTRPSVSLSGPVEQPEEAEPRVWKCQPVGYAQSARPAATPKPVRAAATSQALPAKNMQKGTAGGAAAAVPRTIRASVQQAVPSACTRRTVEKRTTNSAKTAPPAGT